MPSGCLRWGGDYVEALDQGAFFDAIYCVSADQLGAPATALMFLGPFAIASYVYFDSPVPLVVLLMLVGTVFVSTLPAGITQFIAVVLLFVIPGGIFYLTRGLGRR